MYHLIFIKTIDRTLFYSMVAPILMHRSEVWGVYNCKDVDKHLTRRYQAIGNPVVHGEYGKFLLLVICKL